MSPFVKTGPINIKKLKTKGNIKGLIDALNHKDWWVREGAADALGEIKDKRTVEPLIVLLKGEVTIPVIWKAAQALGEIRDVGAVEPLIETFIGSENYRVKQETAFALKKIGFHYISDERTWDLITRFCEEDVKQDELRQSLEKKLLQNEEERKKLASSGLLNRFVQDKNGVWDNQNWLEFLARVRNAGFTNLSDDEINRLLETEKQNYILGVSSTPEQKPCEICNQNTVKSFSFYIAKYRLLDSKSSGTIILRTRTYTYTYDLVGSKQVWICDDCLGKEGFRFARNNMGCAVVGFPIAITIIWALAVFFLSGAVSSNFAKYLCILPLALAFSAFLIFLLVDWIRDFIRIKRDMNYCITYNEKLGIGEKLAIKLHEQTLKAQGYTCFPQKEWEKMAKK